MSRKGQFLFLWILFLSIWTGLFFPVRADAYMPRYVHVTLGVPWIAYLVFLLGVLAPLFLYLGVSWYWRHEIESSGKQGDDQGEE
ncbi:MAG: hypothetical protein M0Z37_09065 [Nitrospiraceae bacterium]|nr:hypothetical protein [Nitrospiraceae bacterium]